MEYKEHPGRAKDEMVIRLESNQPERFVLLDNGTYDLINQVWVFKAKASGSVNPAWLTKSSTWYIYPRPDDVYNPPYSFPYTETTPHTYDQEKPMLTRNWIVVSSTNGPSCQPNKHSSEQAAIDEAKRLALKHPSDTFFVYVLWRAFKVENVKEIEVEDIPF